MQPKKYAGFWKRFIAYLIDETLITTSLFMLSIPFFIILGAMGAISPGFFDEYGEHSLTSFQFSADVYQDEALGVFVIFMFFGMFILSLLIHWLYFALMHSSAKQATVGKLALSIKVTDMEGNRIGFGKATGRNFSKIISGLILNLGYIIAAFTEKKQALHDMIAGTVVINKDYEIWMLVQEDLRKYEENKRAEQAAKDAEAALIAEEQEPAPVVNDTEPESSLRADAEEEDENTTTSEQSPGEEIVDVEPEDAIRAERLLMLNPKMQSVQIPRRQHPK